MTYVLFWQRMNKAKMYFELNLDITEKNLPFEKQKVF